MQPTRSPSLFCPRCYRNWSEFASHDSTEHRATGAESAQHARRRYRTGRSPVRARLAPFNSLMGAPLSPTPREGGVGPALRRETNVQFARRRSLERRGQSSTPSPQRPLGSAGVFAMPVAFVLAAVGCGRRAAGCGSSASLLRVLAPRASRRFFAIHSALATLELDDGRRLLQCVTEATEEAWRNHTLTQPGTLTSRLPAEKSASAPGLTQGPPTASAHARPCQRSCAARRATIATSTSSIRPSRSTGQTVRFLVSTSVRVGGVA